MSEQAATKPSLDSLGKDHPQKRSALWCCTFLLITYVPGIDTATIASVRVSPQALWVIQSLLLVGAVYYTVGFFLDWQVTRSQRKELFQTKEIHSKVIEIVSKFDFGKDLKIEINSATRLIKDIFPAIQREFDVDTLAEKIKLENISEIQGEIDKLTQTSLGFINQAAGHAPENRTNNLMLMYAESMAITMQSQVSGIFSASNQALIDKIRNFSNELSSLKENIALLDSYYEKSKEIGEDLKKFYKEISPSLRTEEIRDKFWDAGGLFLFCLLILCLYFWNNFLPFIIYLSLEFFGPMFAGIFGHVRSAT